MARKENVVPVESAGVGDTVSVSWKDVDVDRVARGKIASIERAGYLRLFISEGGSIIGKYDVTRPRAVRCVMHQRYENMPTLPGLELHNV